MGRKQSTPLPGPAISTPKDEKINQPFCVDWVNSVYKIINDKGDLEEAGTVLAICNNLIFLKPLSDAQLIELSKVVKCAVDFELSNRES